jgi:hypothetical protein
VSEKADQLDRVGAPLLEPGAKLGTGQRAEDGLDEDGLALGRLESGRRLGAPAPEPEALRVLRSVSSFPFGSISKLLANRRRLASV